MSTGLSPRIVRLEALEERVRVRLEGVSADLVECPDCNIVTVRGELYPLEGATLTMDIQVYASAHAENGEVLAVNHEDHPCKGFFGFAPFKIYLTSRLGAPIASIKVYPR